MQLNQVSTSGPTLGTQASSQSATPTLGENAFLQMLVTQLQNQDPMNPLQSTDLAAQLAQFSSVEQLTQLNAAVQNQTNTSAVMAQSINNTMAATLIGKKVKADTSSISYDGTTQPQVGFTLGANAADVKLKILDANGGTVKTVDLGPKLSGDTQYTWDGTDDSGNPVAAGSYTFSVAATDSNGSSVTSTPFVLGLVQGVKYSSSGASLLVNGAEVNFSDVQEVVGN